MTKPIAQKQRLKHDRKASTRPRNVVVVTAYAAESSDPDARQQLSDDATAKRLTQPEVQAATVIQQFEGDNHEVNAVIRELEHQVSLVKSGDLGRCEAMLIAHAHTLDEVFSMYTRKAHANFLAGYADAGERYMRLALKAQSQCRTTLEALAEVKNPRHVAFVRQANIAHGPQQVNNGQQPETPARGQSENQSNELSQTDELLPHVQAPETSIDCNKEVAPVGEIYRATYLPREDPKRAE